MSSEDWFGDFTPDLSWGGGLVDSPTESSSSSSSSTDVTTAAGTRAETDVDPHLLNLEHGKNVVHKRGLNLDMTKLLQIMAQACPPEKRPVMEIFMQYFILNTYGKRNIRKDAVNVSKLTSEQREVYDRIRQELENPIRRERVFSFIQQKDITKRLINYFVVHYSLVDRELSYYLNKTSYPYKIVGDINKPQQPEILARKEQGENIVWVNFHQAYKDSKNQKGRRNRHAPYRRSTSVQGEDGQEYSLCELNFYLWLDDVGGFELFYLFEQDVRAKKSKYDEQKRLQESHIQTGKKKKRKIILRETDGRNYKTHVTKCPSFAPFTLQKPTCTFQEYMLKLKKQAEEQPPETEEKTASPKKRQKKKN